MRNSSLQEQLNKSIKLANLDLAKDEKKALLADLPKILHFVATIKQSEKKGEAKFGKNIKPDEREYPQTKKTNALRSDVIAPFSNLKGLLVEIPQKKNNLIKVKKI
jgi:aspartyl/glutamyl-tRNA(Asn/Gln) amidotransferase C subunit